MISFKETDGCKNGLKTEPSWSPSSGIHFFNEGHEF